ncbi:MAG: diacylglycerol kinase family protein [Sphingomicrobium sp.]
MDALVIINRGGGRADDGSADRVRQALATAGVAADVVEVEGKDLAERAAKAVTAGVKLVVAAGGDGTVSAIAGALADSAATMGVIPLGTLNHFARDLGIPADLDKACALLGAGRPRRIDLAELNGRIFINNSALGLYPLMVMDREAQQNRLGRSKLLAMVVASVRALARFRHHRLSLTVNESLKRIDTPLLFVGNNDYRLDIGGAGQRDSLNGGRLCVFVMGPHGRLGLFAVMLRVLFGSARPGDMVQLDDVQRLRLDSHRSYLTVSLDGEICQQKPPLDYRVRPKALTVLAP